MSDINSHIKDGGNFEKLWNEKCKKFDIEMQPHILPPVERIIVMGDIHGDWKMLTKFLKIAQVIDDKGKWIGGSTVVVQVGDQIDRCRFKDISCSKEEATRPDEGNDYKILKYLVELHRQARDDGGAVYSLMGNHELMNVDGNLNYVSYQGLREFDNFKTREGVVMANGEEARLHAFAPGNEISEFLACTRQMVLIIGSNIFVHAGVLPYIAKKYGVKELNELMSLYLFDKLKNPDEFDDVFKSSKLSPLWTRTFGRFGLEVYSGLMNDKAQIASKCKGLLDPLRDNYKVDKIYVGHTPLIEHGIGNICDEKIWLTDYGSSRAFNKFDSQLIKNPEGKRSQTREAQVLEIREDGKKIRIIK